MEPSSSSSEQSVHEYTPANRSRVWIEPHPVQVSDALVSAAGHPLVARILVRRGLVTPALARAFLDPDAYEPAPPSDLPDLTTAAARLCDAIHRGERILVWGDFDVDGQTSVSLLVLTLTELGAKVRSYIPHRLREGHGIKLSSLRTRLTNTDLLLTCDTGVAEHESIAWARSQGIAVLVTDHHDLPPELPPADAIVDPKCLPPTHPLRDLPGVGVAYKLIQEVHSLLGLDVERAEAVLDLVSLGIVADVATQTGDTRYLLQRGMPRLRQTDRPGLQALMQITQINPAQLTTDHIGFGLSPRLNALGRLGDANLAVELLTTDDLSRARILAAQLEGLNHRRRLLTEQIYAAAQEQIAREPTFLDHYALVLSGPRWHPGVIGIVASRLAEIYRLPTVLISEGEDGRGQGSARSVAGVDIHAAISGVDALLIDHGGHPGAAGLSLPVDRIPEFRSALSGAVEEIWDQSTTPGLAIDAVLPWSELSLELVDTLRALAPFGEGNPPVLFATPGLSLVSERVFGLNQNHRRITVRDSGGITRDVIWWRGAEYSLPVGQFDLAYLLKSSDYRGERSLQIEYVDTRIVAAVPAEVALPAIQIVDNRAIADPVRLLQRMRVAGNVTIWAEGYPPDQSPGLMRDQLAPNPTLIVWTAPPGPREWQAVLDRVTPNTVQLFAVAGEGTDPHRFLPRLAGLIKHTIRQKNGIADLEQLAALCAQRIESVREGIRLLDARGDVRIVEESTNAIQLVPGDGHRKPGIEDIQARLQSLLQETAAYRVHFARAAPERLI